MGARRSLDVEVVSTDVAKRFVIVHNGHTGVHEERMCAQHSMYGSTTAVATRGP